MTDVLAKDVVFTTDGEGNKFYMHWSCLNDWDEIVDSHCGDSDTFDIPDYATPVEGEIYIVDIKRRI